MDTSKQPPSPNWEDQTIPRSPAEVAKTEALQWMQLGLAAAKSTGRQMAHVVQSVVNPRYNPYRWKNPMGAQMDFSGTDKPQYSDKELMKMYRKDESYAFPAEHGRTGMPAEIEKKAQYRLKLDKIAREIRAKNGR